MKSPARSDPIWKAAYGQTVLFCVLGFMVFGAGLGLLFSAIAARGPEIWTWVSIGLMVGGLAVGILARLKISRLMASTDPGRSQG